MNFLKAMPIAAVTAVSLLAPLAHAQQQQEQSMKGHEMMSMMEKNHDKMMSMPMTGKVDVDFAMMMREHHQSAIEMAQWQLHNGKDQKMKDFAKKTMAEQKKEIAELDQFIAKNSGSGAMGASGQSGTK